MLKGNFASFVFHSCNTKTQKTQICVTGLQRIKLKILTLGTTELILRMIKQQADRSNALHLYSGDAQFEYSWDSTSHDQCMPWCSSDLSTELRIPFLSKLFQFIVPQSPPILHYTV
jgi:hypothetical protein